MISSPCIKCPNKDMPKDQCLSECEKLNRIQDFQVARREDVYSYAIDYAEEISCIMGNKRTVLESTVY